MNNKWLKFKHWLKISLFPYPCLLCKSEHTQGSDICMQCLQDLPWLPTSSCPQCRLASSHGLVCGSCIKNAPSFDSTNALFEYAFPIDLMLQKYKYQHALVYAHVFAQMMIDVLKVNQADFIIPMPLHPKRLSERGFNQSLEIARLISESLGIPLVHACERVKFSAPQASLPLKARIHNMKGAFICNQDLAGRRVILIDDVMTTGASLNALAKAVKAKGAAHVECWIIARTLPK